MDFELLRSCRLDGKTERPVDHASPEGMQYDLLGVRCIHEIVKSSISR
jgi:hypothetical protein